MPRDLSAARTSSPQSPLSLIAVVAVAAATVVAVGWTTARGLETCWDERVDLDIAIGLDHDPLFGERPTLDGSQTRWPMYVTALAFAVTGRDDLAVARGVSLLFSAVTIVATSLLGRRLFGAAVGMLTAALLACSPYFIAYSRIAMTEGDAAFTCLIVLSLWAFVEYQRRPTAVRWLAVGLLTGLAVGAKLYGVVLPLVYAVLEWWGDHLPQDVGGRRRGRNPGGCVLGAGWLLVLVGGVLALAVRNAQHDQAADRGPALEAAAIACWALLLLVWMAFVVLTLRRQAVFHGRGRRLVELALFAGLTFFALMPVHLLQHDIAREVVRLLLETDRSPPISLGDRAGLYLGIILYKYPVQLGLLTGAGVVWGLLRARRRAAWRTCVTPIVIYVGLLLFLPLRQTFYLMPVYPLLMIATAALILEAVAWMRPLGWVRAPLVLLLAGWTAWQHAGDVRHVFPHLHLHGINRVDGAALGYRNLIQTPSDGVESLIRWCNQPGNVPPNSRVVSFLWEQHLIKPLLPAKPHYIFIPRGALPERDRLSPPPRWDAADFVLLHLNNLVGYGDHPPDGPTRESLISAGFRPVFTVSRGPLEVGWAWRREGRWPGQAEPESPTKPAAGRPALGEPSQSPKKP